MRVRVAIVEEDRELSEALLMYLNYEGFEASVILQPDENRISALRPEVIILGEQFEHTTGLQVCREVKTFAVTAQVPVIMISDEPVVRQMVGYKDCPDDYISQPFEMAYLVRKIKRQLEWKTRRL